MPIQLVGKRTLEHRVSGPQPVSEFDKQCIITLLSALLPLEQSLQSQGVQTEALVGPGGLQSLLARVNPPPAAEDDTVFTHRRLPGNVINRIEQEHTVNGVMQFWASRYAMGKAALTGWTTAEDEDGHAMPFDPDLIDYLPGTIVRDIGLKVGELTTQRPLALSNDLSTVTAAASEAKPAATAAEN